MIYFWTQITYNTSVVEERKEKLETVSQAKQEIINELNSLEHEAVEIHGIDWVIQEDLAAAPIEALQEFLAEIKETIKELTSTAPIEEEEIDEEVQAFLDELNKTITK